jgi:hypothetical protein
MEHKKLNVLQEVIRPGAQALVGDFFTHPESLCGSIFLLPGG